MIATKVVHVSSQEWVHAVADGTAVYIGRAIPRRGFKSSRWGNPYRIGTDGNRDDIIRLHDDSLRRQCASDPLLIEVIRDELRGHVLGCWCAPERCHGDLLAMLADMSDEDYHAWLNRKS